MIVEGIVTTRSLAGSLNIAPMGPIVRDDWETLVLRPFQSSTTYQNLAEHPEGVFHVTDDASLLAATAIGREVHPETKPAREIRGEILTGACRAYEFRIVASDVASERTTLTARVLRVERLRDFLGWNRAKHAVLEAAILATRVHLLDHDEIAGQFRHLAVMVDKTGGMNERAAFELLRDHLVQCGVDVAS